MKKIASSLLFLLCFGSVVVFADTQETVPNIGQNSKICAEVYIKDDYNYINIITASTALIAVIVGPLVSLYIMRKQIYTPLNYDLANKARESIAKFLAMADHIQDSDRRKILNEKDKQEMLKELRIPCNNAKLLLSDSGVSARELFDCMDFIANKISEAYSIYSEHEDHINQKKNEMRTCALKAIKFLEGNRG